MKDKPVYAWLRWNGGAGMFEGLELIVSRGGNLTERSFNARTLLLLSSGKEIYWDALHWRVFTRALWVVTDLEEL